MAYRGIIFDLNGVLVEDTPAHRQAWNDLVHNHDVRAFTDDEWRSVQGRSTKELLPLLFGATMSDTELDELEKEKDLRYRRILQTSIEVSLAAGADTLLDRLVEHGIPRAIATSSNPDDVAFLVAHLGLQRWFAADQIVCNDGEFPDKPAPDVYLEAARRIHVPPSECVVVDDSPSGVAAAKAAGAGKIIGVASRERREDLLQAGAGETLEHVAELNLALFESKPTP
ncbi:MAG: HAD family hydrolase [Minisyncoccia bacterium]